MTTPQFIALLGTLTAIGAVILGAAWRLARATAPQPSDAATDARLSADLANLGRRFDEMLVMVREIAAQTGKLPALDQRVTTLEGDMKGVRERQHANATEVTTALIRLADRLIERPSGPAAKGG